MVNTGRSRGGRRGCRIGGIAVCEADNLGPSNNESTEVVGIDVRPLVPVVHSREAGEFAGRGLVGAPILNVYLTTGGNSKSPGYELNADGIHTRSLGSTGADRQNGEQRFHSEPTVGGEGTSVLSS